MQINLGIVIPNTSYCTQIAHVTPGVESPQSCPLGGHILVTDMFLTFVMHLSTSYYFTLLSYFIQTEFSWGFNYQVLHICLIV